MEPPSLEGNLHGGGQKPSTSPKPLGHQVGASPILGQWEWQSPLNRAASKCRVYQSSRCLSKMPPVGGDIPVYRPLLPSEPLYLTMTSVSKTCTSHSTALCSDMRVFSGASWKKE